jgi:thiol reductant ABC exporter CydD subunit
MFLVLCVVLGVVWAGLVVAQATVLADGLTGAPLAPALAWLAGVVLARAVTAWAQEAAAHRTAATARLRLRERVLEHVVRLGPAWLTAERGGELTTLVTRGVDALDGYFARYLPQLVLALIVPVVVLARVLRADLVAGLTIVVTLPLIPVFMVLVGRGTAAASRRQFHFLSRLSHHFLDVVTGLPTLRAFGRAHAQVRTIARVTDQYRALTMRTMRLAFASGLVLELLATLSVALVAVGIGLRLVGGGLDLRTALVVLILAPEAYLPLRMVGSHYHASVEGLAALAEVFAVLETPTPARAAGHPPVTGVTLAGVSVWYPDRAAPALADFSLTVAPGEVIVLTGPSGSGKSTVLSLLLGFVTPSAGTASPVFAIDRDEWLARVAWLPQNPLLEIDADLSAGQRQRRALARALARPADLLLLDEPTAHLDPASEAEAVDEIRRSCAGRTAVIAAHRPAVLALADRVVRLSLAAAEPTGPAVDSNASAATPATGSTDPADTAALTVS